MATVKQIKKAVGQALRLNPESPRFEKALVARIRAVGVGLTCGRCGGSGRYSFNLKDGDRCYGCQGAGNVPPRNKTGWLVVQENVNAAVENGTVDRYLRVRGALAITRKASERVLYAWKGTGVGTRYAWIKAATATRLADEGAEVPDELRYHREIADVNAKMCDAYQRVDKAEHQLMVAARAGREEHWAAVETLATTVEAALADIEAAAEELAVKLAEWETRGIVYGR